jgi:hypothetical protein
VVGRQDRIWSYQDEARRNNITGGAGYHDGLIFDTGTGVDDIVDNLMVLLIGTRFLWKRAFQNENLRVSECRDALMAFSIFSSFFAAASFDTAIIRVVQLSAVFAAASVLPAPSITITRLHE